MKGVLFNIFEEFIIENYGDEVYDDILDAATLTTEEPYVGPGTYPDADMFSLVGAACERLGVSLEVALKAYGRFCLPGLATRYPVFFEGIEHPKDILKIVDSVIHVEVHKMYPKAVLPSFDCEEHPDGSMSMIYRSHRKLCTVAEGLIEGVGDWFSIPIELAHSRCVHKGDDHCRFDLKFGAQTEQDSDAA